MIESNQDIIGLSTFIISRLLSNHAIAKDYSRSINLESISNDKGIHKWFAAGTHLSQYIVNSIQ